MTGTPSSSADVLIVGGGPAGLAAAIELGRRDRRVVLVDRGRASPTASQLLTPRAVAAIRRLGIAAGDDGHPVEHVRLTALEPGGGTRSIATRWPELHGTPDVATVADRDELIDGLTGLAARFGVELLMGDAVSPLVDRGFVRGATVRHEGGATTELRATYTIVADGANSQFGRLLGTIRDPDWPVAVAHAADYDSPLHAAGEAEFVLGVTDRVGTPIVGYGWMFPTGLGRVSVGLMMVSTSPSFQVINPAHLHQRLVEDQRGRWQLGDAVTPPTGGRIPIGGSVGPLAGPTYLITGDAGGIANPFTGSGIDTAFETGIVAADVVAEALSSGNPAELQQYPRQLDDRYGSYDKIGRLVDRALGRPAFARWMHAQIVGNRPVADGTVRIALQHLRRGRGGLPELMYRVGRTVSIFAPDA